MGTIIEQYTPTPISVLNNKVIEYEDIGTDTSSEIFQELVDVWGVNEQTAVKLTISHPEYVIKAVVADIKKRLDNKKIDTRKYIADYCKKNDLSASALEHQVGTAKDAIYSFLIGKVVDLKLSTAVKIADTLSISLDDLVERQDALKKFSPRSGKTLKYNPPLTDEIFSYVRHYAENNKNYEYNFREIMYAINEIYEYSMDNDINHMDKKFAEWFCKSQMHLLK